MTRVKLRCIIGCPGLKSSYREKGILYEGNFKHKYMRSVCKLQDFIYRPAMLYIYVTCTRY